MKAKFTSAPADLQAMAACGGAVQLQSQQTLPQVQDARHWYLLVQGQVCVRYYGSQGRELVLAELQSGQWCSAGREAGGSVLTQAMEVRTLTPCLIAYWDDAAMQHLLRRQPQLAWPVLTGVQSMSCTLLLRLIQMGTLQVRARVVDKLLALAQAEDAQGQQVCLAPAPTQAHLAATLSCSREEVAREMSRLAALGLLRREGRRLHLLDVAALRRLHASG